MAIWRRGRVLLSAAVLLAIGGGCRMFASRSGAGTGPANNPPSASGRRIRVFSESLPVNAIAYQAPYLWAGNDRGLVRWDVNTEDVQRAGSDQGLPGQRVSALALDAQGGLWVKTEAGLGRLHGGKYVAMPPATAPLTSIAPLPSGAGAWAGGPTGLYRTDGRRWVEIEALRGVAVNGIEVEGGGASVWAATRGRGVARVDDHGVRWFGPSEGFDLSDAVGSVTLDTGIRMTAGRGATGARLLVIDGAAIDLLAATPDVPFQRIARVAGEVVLLAGPASAPRLYKLRRLKRGEPAPEDGFRILPIRRGSDAPRLGAVPLLLEPPPRTTVIATTADAIWFGTEALGVARADRGAPTYFRSSDLVEGAERLSVACLAPDRCVVATGGPRVWLFDGRGFAATDVAQPKGTEVEAALLDGQARAYTVAQQPGGGDITVTRADGGAWKEIRRVTAVVPQGRPLLAFAALAPAGSLWLGVKYLDDDGQERRYGVIEVDLEKDRVLHHRRYDKGETGPPGSLPLGNDLTGMAFDGPTLWFSSEVGVLRWQEAQIKTWGENEGLESELCQGIAVTSEGRVAVATPDGVGTFDGRVWRFPADGPTRVRTRALARDARGHVWAASTRGLLEIGAASITWHGSKSDIRDSEIVDVTVDARGRVWALGKDSIAVIE